MASFHRIFAPLLMITILLAFFRGAAASASPQPEALRLFEYDASAPLDLQVVISRKKGPLTIQEITYASPKGGRVPGTLIVPDGPGPFAGILLMHGMPGDHGVTLPEAETLARRGAVTLSIDAPFSRPGHRGEPVLMTEQDRDNQVQLIVDWRRGVDLLLSRKDVDPRRLAYTGRSYGGAMGGLLAGVEKRIKAYALVVGDGGLISHFKAEDGEPNPLLRLSKEARARWLAAMEPIEPLNWVGRAAPARLLFQNGRRDQMVPEASARIYQAAGSEPKTLKWYDADHFLNDRATRDRHRWLAGQIGIAKP
jgi:dienelactone hydrolase